MDISVIMQAIGAVGFPIVMCLIMFWYVRELSDNHKKEVEEFSEALNNNTLVLQKVCDKLDELKGGLVK